MVIGLVRVSTNVEAKAPQQTAVPFGGRLFSKFGYEGLAAEVYRKSAADRVDQRLLTGQELGDKGQAKSRDGAIGSIRDGCTQSGDQPRDATLRQRSLNGQNADSADGRRNREANGRSS